MLKSYCDEPHDNTELSFYLIYDKKRELYEEGRGSLGTMNNAEVYRSHGSAADAMKDIERAYARHIEVCKQDPKGWKKYYKEWRIDLGMPDLVAVMHTVRVGTLPTYSRKDLLRLKLDRKKERNP